MTELGQNFKDAGYESHHHTPTLERGKVINPKIYISQDLIIDSPNIKFFAFKKMALRGPDNENIVSL